MKRCTGRVEFTLPSPETIERILTEWEQEHPGKRASADMDADEFADRMMIEIMASAREVP